MSGEYGNRLFIELLVDFFSGAPMVLWVYPVLAFTYANSVPQSGFRGTLKKMFVSLREMNSDIRPSNFHIVFMVNAGYSLLIVVLLGAIAFSNGILLTLIAISLNAFGIAYSFSALIKISVISALLILVGHLGHSSKEEGETTNTGF